MPDPDAGVLAIRTSINGVRHGLDVEPGETLASLLRDRLGLTGTKVSCGVQVCGACTVLLDGLAVSACSVLAVEADGREVRTIEGLARDGSLTPLQQAFIDCGALQCGFCTPGLLMACTELLERHADPDEDTIRSWLEGNVCRCTGYRRIVEAVRRAATLGRGAGAGDLPGPPIDRDPAGAGTGWAGRGAPPPEDGAQGGPRSGGRG